MVDPHRKAAGSKGHRRACNPLGRHKEIAFRARLDVLEANVRTGWHCDQRVLRRINPTRSMRNRVPRIIIQSDVRRPDSLN